MSTALRDEFLVFLGLGHDAYRSWNLVDVPDMKQLTAPPGSQPQPGWTRTPPEKAATARTGGFYPRAMVRSTVWRIPPFR